MPSSEVWQPWRSTRRVRVLWDALLNREGGDPYDLDQHGGGDGFGGELHVHSLPAGPAASYGMS
ncbi:hypothetical protein ACFWNT_45350 [Streptomyces sp. NPDC058409]|uniref:hypothetical protein n=1 Tax=Streptomyces sp. NPDC058409 TaxID=3346484 RepID=UPI00364C7CB2